MPLGFELKIFILQKKIFAEVVKNFALKFSPGLLNGWLQCCHQRTVTWIQLAHNLDLACFSELLWRQQYIALDSDGKCTWSSGYFGSNPMHITHCDDNNQFWILLILVKSEAYVQILLILLWLTRKFHAHFWLQFVVGLARQINSSRGNEVHGLWTDIFHPQRLKIQK